MNTMRNVKMSKFTYTCESLSGALVYTPYFIHVQFKVQQRRNSLLFGIQFVRA